MPSITPPNQGATELLRDRAVADLLDVTQRTLATWRAERTNLPFIRVGHGVRYSRADVDAYLQSARIQPRNGPSPSESEK